MPSSLICLLLADFELAVVVCAPFHLVLELALWLKADPFCMRVVSRIMFELLHFLTSLTRLAECKSGIGHACWEARL